MLKLLVALSSLSSEEQHLLIYPTLAFPFQSRNVGHRLQVSPSRFAGGDDEFRRYSRTAAYNPYVRAFCAQ